MARKPVPSSTGRLILAVILSGLALLPKLLALPGLRLLNDSISITVVTVLVRELYPAAGVGFLLLLSYLVFAEFVREGSSNASALQLSISSVLGLSLAIGYVLFSLALWIDSWVVQDVAHGVIISASRAIYMSPVRMVVDPVTVRSVEMSLVSTVNSVHRLFVRSSARSTRWPAYLFVSYLAVAELSTRTGWLDGASRTMQLTVRAVAAVFTLIYGLVLAHNFFPTPDTLPWRAPTISLWLLVHTSISALVLTLLRPVTTTETDQSRPFVPATVAVFLLLGIVIAVIDGLYPLPEVLLIGSVSAVAVGRWLSVPRLRRFTVRAADVETQLLEGLAAAWSEPERLFGLFVAFEGFWLGGRVVWMVLFSIGSPFSSSVELSPLAAVLLVVLLSPVVLAAGYWMWFWTYEVRRHVRSADTPERLPDLLVFPTMAIASFLVANRLFEIHLVVGLFAVGGVLLGLAGMRWSVRARRSGRSFPWSEDDHVMALAFLVQFGGLELASQISPSSYDSSGPHLLVLLLTLVPLYWYPKVRRDGVGPIPSLPASLGIVAVVTAVVTPYAARFEPFVIFNSGLLGVAAVMLAWSMTLRDAFTAVR
ncbi:hypothetical protein [Halorussus ruber]|uniref:hypothetical protein n=1 Tax=Halorussus ruber TaxID=1126238 RepID=UPI0010919CD2|nr:hypothetical protein [Halorussus ruber]